jgi:hypothetical protein
VDGRGNGLQANEALEVLALRPGATSGQIKEAYRDLVKVWHPDRFGSDARLRLKAEEKLRQINEAYEVLVQSSAGVVASHGAGPVRAAGAKEGDVSPPRYSSSVRVAARGRGRSKRAGTGWFYVCVAVGVALLVGYLVIVSMAGESEGAPSPVPQAASPPVPQTMGGGVIAGHAPPAGSNTRSSGDSKGNGAGRFAVRSLSEAETARLEEACEPQRERLGPVAYQVCMTAQVGLMTNPAGPPYLGALNAAERESIKSACAEAKRAGGEDGYDRCLTAKMAEWAAEPARPKLSTLNDADKASVELACRGAKEREGPAAYDRCLVRFMRALAEGR